MISFERKKTLLNNDTIWDILTLWLSAAIKFLAIYNYSLIKS